MITSLKKRLYAYLLKAGKPVASGDLQRIVAEKTTYTPSNVSRRLRELETEGQITVEYKDGHAWYSALSIDEQFKNF